jgi:carboxylesterase type B
MRKNILKLTKMLIIYINLMIFSLWTSNAQSNEYHLTSGVYKAIEVKFQYKNLSLDVHRLMNIPYAQTPQLFDKPAETFSSNSNMSFAQSSNKWPNMCVQTRIFNADFYGNLRLPHKTYMSFDCLTINLYIPADRAGNLSAMFFVHGGSNAVGTSSYVDASVLASLGNVLVATVNYRLDVLGFFSMPSSSSSKEKKYKGNYGLWDQLAAIKWLYKNCPSLGCNPDSITLFGHSAGSANVLFHALSEHARPYVKRIIMQSGSGLAHWATNYEQYLIDISESGNKQALSLFKNSR